MYHVLLGFERPVVAMPLYRPITANDRLGGKGSLAIERD
jgi:hypothetical protein